MWGYFFLDYKAFHWTFLHRQFSLYLTFSLLLNYYIELAWYFKGVEIST